ncbi:MAG TPA: hypothetical protein VM577_13565 [Anaerovoracaceae bacterium]|nr:hypothetical protein [Anaerovoracaceae bacterium]
MAGPIDQYPGGKTGMMPMPPAESGLGFRDILDRLKKVLGGRSVEAAANVLKPKTTPSPTLPPEFTPVGGEDAYNVMQPKPAPTNLMEQIYNRILQNGGR